MGRVKTKNIKRAGNQLLEQFPEEFTGEFAENKLAVSKLTTAQSKSLRNKIAGYIVTTRKKIRD
jgi:small subunit ribosomal protein S17e